MFKRLSYLPDDEYARTVMSSFAPAICSPLKQSDSNQTLAQNTTRNQEPEGF